MPQPVIHRFADFVVGACVPPEARAAARTAYLDTVSVTLAGAVEPAALIVQDAARAEGGHPRCRIIGTPHATSASWAALANGTAAHALDGRIIDAATIRRAREILKA